MRPKDQNDSICNQTIVNYNFDFFFFKSEILQLPKNKLFFSIDYDYYVKSVVVDWTEIWLY